MLNTSSREYRSVRQALAAWAGLLVVACAVLVTGCGGEPPPKLVQVKGKVQEAGKPVTAGSIHFYPAGSNEFQKDNPSSLLQTDGSFLMKTYPFGEGVTLGKYKVTLSPELATRLKKPNYAKPDTTPWEIEVGEAGVADHLLEVK